MPQTLAKAKCKMGRDGKKNALDPARAAFDRFGTPVQAA
jgi:hypothetical protein